MSKTKVLPFMNTWKTHKKITDTHKASKNAAVRLLFMRLKSDPCLALLKVVQEPAADPQCLNQFSNDRSQFLRLHNPILILYCTKLQYKTWYNCRMGWHSVADTHRYYYLLFIIRLYVSYIAFLFLPFFFLTNTIWKLAMPFLSLYLETVKWERLWKPLAWAC